MSFGDLMLIINYKKTNKRKPKSDHTGTKKFKKNQTATRWIFQKRHFYYYFKCFRNYNFQVFPQQFHLLILYGLLKQFPNRTRSIYWSGFFFQRTHVRKFCFQSVPLGFCSCFYVEDIFKNSSKNLSINFFEFQDFNQKFWNWKLLHRFLSDFPWSNPRDKP